MNSPPDKAVGAPDESPGEILTHEARFADDFRRQYPTVWWLTLIGPFLATGGMLAFLWVSRGGEFVAKVVGTALATFFGLGRFVILFGSDMQNAGHEAEVNQFGFMNSHELFVMVTWMDLLAASLLIFHASFMFRIPRIGPAMLRLKQDGEFIAQTQPLVRRFTFIGLIIFVAVPIAATGSVGGSIFGRLLGLSRKATFTGLVLGTLLGNGLMLLGSKALDKIPIFNKDSPLNLVVGLAVVIGVIVLLNWRYNRLKRDWAAQGRGPGSTPDSRN